MQTQMEEEDMSDDEFFVTMPPGYQFRPRDDELIYYLVLKIKNEPLPPNRIHVVNLYESNPENLAEKYKAGGKNAWYFFTSRQKKYKNGSRPNRAAGDGFWKASGSDKSIKRNGEEIGCKKSLVYHRGKPRGATKTDWMMSEFRVKNAPAPVQTAENSMRLDDWVLCRMYKKTTKPAVGTKRSREANELAEEMIECRNPNDQYSTNIAANKFTKAEIGNPCHDAADVKIPHPNLPNYSSGAYEPPLPRNVAAPPNAWAYYPHQPFDVSPSVRFFNPAVGSIPFDYQVGIIPGVGPMVAFDRLPGLRSVDIVNDFSAPITFTPPMYPGPPNHISLGNHFTSGGCSHYLMNHGPTMPILGSLDETIREILGPQRSLMDGLDEYGTARINKTLKNSSKSDQ